MKVYVITKGTYSDYQICGVATDPEDALLKQIFYSDGWGDADIEEYDTDDKPELSKIGYLVKRRFGTKELVPEKLINVDVMSANVLRSHSDGEWDLEVCVATSDPDSAVKIAAEKFAEYDYEHLDPCESCAHVIKTCYNTRGDRTILCRPGNGREQFIEGRVPYCSDHVKKEDI